MFEEILKEVPNYKSFYTVDELNDSSRQLAREFSENVKLIKIGKSRRGEDIPALRIGEGKKKAILFGFPHPDEPIGGMMLEYFSRRLVEDESLDKLDFTWYIVKCIDPDGTRLNEGWFRGPFNPLHIAMNYYRPPNRQQVEWTFPVDYKTLHWHRPLPETRALMKLIDETKPDFLYSLHNSFFGGAFFLVDVHCRSLYPRFRSLAEEENLSLHLSDAWAPFIKRLSPAVFELFWMKEYYDYLEEHGSKDPARTLRMGASSDEYARRTADTFNLAVEIPYWFDPRIGDASESDVTRREAILHRSKMALKRNRLIRKKYLEVRRKSEPSEYTKPFSDAIEYFTRRNMNDAISEENWANSDRSLSRKATVAEKFESYTAMQAYDLLPLGMLYRYAKEAGDRGSEEEILSQLRAWTSELKRQMSFHVTPIQSLVRVQLGAALLACNYIQKSRGLPRGN